MTLAGIIPELSVQETYKGRNSSIDAYKAVEAFFHMFGIPPAGVSSEFRRKLTECVERHHPDLACSAARTLFEGRVLGIPKPVWPIEPGWRLRVEVGLILLDCFETLVRESLVGQNPSSAERNERQMKMVSPPKKGLAHAIEDSKAKKGDASRSRR